GPGSSVDSSSSLQGRCVLRSESVRPARTHDSSSASHRIERTSLAADGRLSRRSGRNYRRKRRELFRQSPAGHATRGLHSAVGLYHRSTRSCCPRIRLHCASQPRATAGSYTCARASRNHVYPGSVDCDVSPALRCTRKYPSRQTQLLDGELRSWSQVFLRHGNLFHYLHRAFL